MKTFRTFTAEKSVQIDEASDVKKVRDTVIADGVGRSPEGHVVVRQGFYYTHGKTSQKHADNVSGQLTKAGIKHTVVGHGEHSAPFRGGAPLAKSSHWWVKVKLHEGNVNEDAASNRASVAAKKVDHISNDDELARRVFKAWTGT